MPRTLTNDELRSVLLRDDLSAVVKKLTTDELQRLQAVMAEDEAREQIGARAEARLEGLQEPFEAPETSPFHSVASAMETPSKVFAGVTSVGIPETIRSVFGMTPPGAEPTRKAPPQAPNALVGMPGGVITDAVKSVADKGKFVLSMMNPATAEFAAGARLAQNIFEAVVEPSKETISAFGRAGGLEEMAQKEPTLLAEGLFDLGSLAVGGTKGVTGIPKALRVAKEGASLKQIAGALVKTARDDYKAAKLVTDVTGGALTPVAPFTRRGLQAGITAKVLDGATKTSDELAEAAVEARKVGKHIEADEIAARKRNIDRQIAEMTGEAGKKVEKDIEVLKREGPVPLDVDLAERAAFPGVAATAERLGSEARGVATIPAALSPKVKNVGDAVDILKSSVEANASILKPADLRELRQGLKQIFQQKKKPAAEMLAELEEKFTAARKRVRLSTKETKKQLRQTGIEPAGAVPARTAPAKSKRDAFFNVGTQQRDAPESAMRKVQRSQISQLYGWLLEHGGDLIHRMSDDSYKFNAGHEFVKEKVDKLLRTLKSRYGVRREISEQITANKAFQAEKGVERAGEITAKRLQLLGREYADAHRKLRPVNEAQKLANDIAVALGEFRLEDAVALLEKMKVHTDNGPAAWAAFARNGIELGSEAGFAQRDLVRTLGGGALGGAIAGSIVGLTEKGFDAQFAPSYIGLGVIAGIGGFKLADPAFRKAVKEFVSIGKPKDFGNAERIFSEFIEPYLPERLTGQQIAPVAAGVTRAGMVGTGALVGGFAGGTDDFDPTRALIGAAGGLALGHYAVRGFDKLFPAGMDAKKIYRKMFTESRGLPPELHAEWLKIKNRTSGRLAEIIDTAKILGKAAGDDPEMGRLLDRAIRQEIPFEAIDNLKLRDSAIRARMLFDEMAIDLVRFEIASGKAAETITANLAAGARGDVTYLPRLLMLYEAEDKLGNFARMVRFKGDDLRKFSDKDYLKGRKDLTPEQLKEWGEIVDNPGYLLGKRGVITNSDIAFGEYAKLIGSSLDYSLTDEMVTAARKAEKAGTSTDTRIFKEFGEDMAEFDGRRYRKLGSSDRYGQFLKNRYVLEEVADDIETLTETSRGVARLVDRATAFFKASKVTLNPATLMRNVFGNAIMADMGGLSPANLRVYKKAWDDYMGMSESYLEARRHGLFGGEYFAEEVRGMLGATRKAPEDTKTMIGFGLNWIDGKLEKGVSKMGRFHEASEQYWKMAMYDYARDTLKLNAPDAVQYAKRYIFDYREIPNWIRVVRKSVFGAPFISFSYKALPRVAENAFAVGDPKKLMRFWKYPLAMGAVNEYSARKFGFIEDDKKGLMPTLQRIVGTGLGFSWGDFGKIKKMMPSYTGSQQVMLPYTDWLGRLQFFDATWTMPWGDLGELGKGKVGEGLASMGVLFPRQLEPSHPILQLTAAALTGGHDPFTGKAVIEPGNEGWRGAIDATGYVMRQFGPQLFTPTGFSQQKIARSLRGDYESDLYTPTLPNAFLSEILGVKIRPLEVTQAMGSKSREFKARYNDLYGRMKTEMRNLPGKFREPVGQYLRGEIDIKGVPHGGKGTARLVKRLQDEINTTADEFQQSLPSPDTVPPPTEAFKRVQRGGEE